MEPIIRLRATTINDIDFVIAAEQHPENSNYVYQWSKDQHSASLTDSNFAHFIIMQQDKPVGYIILDDLQNRYLNT